jgi:hypothetical protein
MPISVNKKKLSLKIILALVQLCFSIVICREIFSAAWSLRGDKAEHAWKGHGGAWAKVSD